MLVPKFRAIFMKVECKGKPAPLHIRVVRDDKLNLSMGGNAKDLDLYWSYENKYPS